jgi:uncharacterized membrane protein YiaA
VTFSAPEENTLGVVITGGRQRVKQPRRSGRVANSAHRASLGVAFLGLGAAIVVGLRAIYGFSWFVALWGADAYPKPIAALAAWIVLVAVLIGAIIAARIINDRLPDWVFALFLTGSRAKTALPKQSGEAAKPGSRQKSTSVHAGSLTRRRSWRSCGAVSPQKGGK